MTFVLHSYPDCASHVVRMVLEELGATYRDEVIDMSAGAHRDPPFLRINPRGMVPVLYDETTGASLAETGAILHYLVEQTGRLAPALGNAKQRALYLQWLFFLSNTLHADAQLQYYTERYVGSDLAEDARPNVHARMRQHFGMIEDTLAAHGGPWLLGDTLSVCDFYLGGCARWSQIAPRHAPLEPGAVGGHPHLKGLLSRLETRQSVIRAFAAEETPVSAYFLAPVRSVHTTDNAG